MSDAPNCDLSASGIRRPIHGRMTALIGRRRGPTSEKRRVPILDLYQGPDRTA